MVVTLNFSHLYHFPIDLVIKTYINKHKHADEKGTMKVDVISSYQEGEMTCVQRRLTFRNYFPDFFRKIDSLKRETVIAEEEIWTQPLESRHWIRSHDKTWEDVTIAHLAYVSKFEKNPNWTLWEQDTVVDLGAFGIFGTVLELYLKRTLNNSMKNEIKLMERLMKSNKIEE